MDTKAIVAALDAYVAANDALLVVYAEQARAEDAVREAEQVLNTSKSLLHSLFEFENSLGKSYTITVSETDERLCLITHQGVRILETIAVER